MLEYKGIDSKFRVVILVSKRAKQLINGSRKRVDLKAENPLTIAMEEFRQGKVNFNILMEEQDKFEQALQSVEETAEVLPPVVEPLSFAVAEPEDEEEADSEDDEDDEDDKDNDESEIDETEAVEKEEEKVD